MIRIVCLATAANRLQWDRWVETHENELLHRAIVTLILPCSAAYDLGLALTEWWNRPGFDLVLVNGIPNSDLIDHWQSCSRSVCVRIDAKHGGRALRFKQDFQLTHSLSEDLEHPFSNCQPGETDTICVEGSPA